MHSSLHSTPPCSRLCQGSVHSRGVLNSRLRRCQLGKRLKVHEYRGSRCLATPSDEPQGEPAQQGYVRFAIQKRVNYKEILNIVGNAEELGNWKRVPGAMLRMKWSEGDVWRAETWLPARPIEYKYLITSDSGEFKEWQAVPKNQVILPNPQVLAFEVSDEWAGAGEGTVTEILRPQEVNPKEQLPPTPSPSGRGDSAAGPGPAPPAAAAAQQPPSPSFTSPTLDERGAGMSARDGGGSNGNGSGPSGSRRGRASNLSPLPPLGYQQQQQQQQHTNGVPSARDSAVGAARQQQVPGKNGGSGVEQAQPLHPLQQQQQQQQPVQQERPFFDAHGVIADPHSWMGSGEEDNTWGYNTDTPTNSGGTPPEGSNGSNGNNGPVRNSSGHDLGNAFTKRYKLPRSKLKVLAVDPDTGAITSRFQHMTVSELQRELKKRYLPVYGNRDALLRRLHSTIGIDGGVPRR